MTQTRQYAVIDRDGFFTDWTKVYSAHATKGAAVKSATKYRVDIPGNALHQSSAMVIQGVSFRKGETIYRDAIRRHYQVVW